MVIMKPPYSYYTDKMWRDFIPRWRWNKNHDVEGTPLLPVQNENYQVCLGIWKDLTTVERQIIEAVTCSERERIGEDVRKISLRTNLDIQHVWHEAFRIGRMTAVRRGLIDDKSQPEYAGLVERANNHGHADRETVANSTGDLMGRGQCNDPRNDETPRPQKG